MSRKNEYQFVLVGAGLAHLIAAKELADMYGPGSVLIIERTKLGNIIENLAGGEAYKDFPPPASLVTPGRGGMGVGHYPDTETYQMVMRSLFLLLEYDPELRYLDGRETDYLILKESTHDPEKLKLVYHESLKIYAAFYASTKEHVRARLPSPDKFAKIMYPDELSYLSSEFKEELAYVVTTLEGRLDMVDAYVRALQKVRDLGVAIQDETDVVSVEAPEPGHYIVKAECRAGPSFEAETPCLSISAWYNSISLINPVLGSHVDPYSYRIKQIADVHVPVTASPADMHSFFVGLGARGCMLAIDKSQELLISGRLYWCAKATSVAHTNVALLQKSEDVDSALRHIRQDMHGRRLRSRRIIEDINKVTGAVGLNKVIYVGDEVQVVMTNKIQCNPEDDLSSVITAGMSDPKSPFNRRQPMVNRVVLLGAPKSSCLMLAPNPKLVCAVETAALVVRSMVEAKSHVTQIQPQPLVCSPVKRERPRLGSNSIDVPEGVVVAKGGRTTSRPFYRKVLPIIDRASRLSPRKRPPTPRKSRASRTPSVPTACFSPQVLRPSSALFGVFSSTHFKPVDPDRGQGVMDMDVAPDPDAVPEGKNSNLCMPGSLFPENQYNTPDTSPTGLVGRDAADVGALKETEFLESSCAGAGVFTCRV